MALFEFITIEGESDGPRVLVTAGVHGDEYEGIEATKLLASSTDRGDLKGTLQLIPIVNESAYKTRDRVGEDSLDLARTFPGDASGTVTQRLAAELAPLIQRADFYIDLHSGGHAMWIEPLVGYMLVADDEVLSKQRAMARAFGLPIIWGTSADLDGRSLSVARDANVPAIYAEYQGGGLCSSDGVAAYLAGCRHVMAQLGIIAPTGDRTSEPVLEIEDKRPGSGHLQVQHRSPVSGTFSPSVRLGETVSEGDLLGIIEKRERTRVHADSSGRIFCLRADPLVNQGDSLAVIMDIK